MNYQVADVPLARPFASLRVITIRPSNNSEREKEREREKEKGREG